MLLELKNITKSFGVKKVLRDVSFSLKQEKIYVLMGENGSGKTTLFNLISGFLHADKGSILLNNSELQKVVPHQRNKQGITRTFQDMRLITELTVIENVLLAFPNQKGEQWWNASLPSSRVSNQEKANVLMANAILEQCFIDDVANSQAGEISFGQQKLLNIACCLANDAKVFLLDEPVAGINPVYRDKLVKLIRRLKELDKIVLIIEHNTDFIESLADEILYLNNGEITHFADYKKFQNSEIVKEVYFL